MKGIGEINEREKERERETGRNDEKRAITKRMRAY